MIIVELILKKENYFRIYAISSLSWGNWSPNFPKVETAAALISGSSKVILLKINRTYFEGDSFDKNVSLLIISKIFIYDKINIFQYFTILNFPFFY